MLYTMLTFYSLTYKKSYANIESWSVKRIFPTEWERSGLLSEWNRSKDPCFHFSLKIIFFFLSNLRTYFIKDSHCAPFCLASSSHFSVFLRFYGDMGEKTTLIFLLLSLPCTIYVILSHTFRNFHYLVWREKCKKKMKKYFIEKLRYEKPPGIVLEV